MDATSPSPEEALPSVESLFSQAWELYLRRLSEVLLVGAAGGLASLASLAVPLCAVWLWKGLEAGPAAWAAATAVGASGALWFMSWLQAATLRCFLDERPGGALERYRETAVEIVPFSWVCLLAALLVMGGVWALIVPGFYLLLGLAFAPWVQLAEGRGGLGALERSLALVRGRWWALAGRLALVAAATTAPSLVPLVGPVLGAAAGPFGLAAVTVLYRSLSAAPSGAEATPTWGGRALLALAAAGLLLPLSGALEVARRWPTVEAALKSEFGALLERPLDPDLARRAVEALGSGGLTRESTSLLYELAVSTGSGREP